LQFWHTHIIAVFHFYCQFGILFHFGLLHQEKSGNDFQTEIGKVPEMTQTWSQSYNLELQRQRCKNLQHHE
jgi:hypothetical protein